MLVKNRASEIRVMQGLGVIYILAVFCHTITNSLRACTIITEIVTINVEKRTKYRDA